MIAVCVVTFLKRNSLKKITETLDALIESFVGKNGAAPKKIFLSFPDWYKLLEETKPEKGELSYQDIPIFRSPDLTTGDITVC